MDSYAPPLGNIGQFIQASAAAAAKENSQIRASQGFSRKRPPPASKMMYNPSLFKRMNRGEAPHRLPPQRITNPSSNVTLSGMASLLRRRLQMHEVMLQGQGQGQGETFGSDGSQRDPKTSFKPEMKVEPQKKVEPMTAEPSWKTNVAPPSCANHLQMHDRMGQAQSRSFASDAPQMRPTFALKTEKKTEDPKKAEPMGKELSWKSNIASPRTHHLRAMDSSGWNSQDSRARQKSAHLQSSATLATLGGPHQPHASLNQNQPQSQRDNVGQRRIAPVVRAPAMGMPHGGQRARMPATMGPSSNGVHHSTHNNTSEVQRTKCANNKSQSSQRESLGGGPSDYWDNNDAGAEGNGPEKRPAKFILRLAQMVNEKCSVSICGWAEDGMSFFASDSQEFCNLRSRHLSGSPKFESFVRQLHNYGFHGQKIVDKKDPRSDSRFKFWHPSFVAGQPELLIKVQRGGSEAVLQDPSGFPADHQAVDMRALAKGLAGISQQVRVLGTLTKQIFLTMRNMQVFMRQGMMNQRHAPPHAQPHQRYPGYANASNSMPSHGGTSHGGRFSSSGNPL